MKLTYYGHASFGVNIAGFNILFDPYISPNKLAGHIDINTIQADFIFISHGHGDHLADFVNIAQRTGATCVGSAEVADWMERQGVKKVHAMNQGGFIDFDFGKVKGVKAVHSSSFPDGSYAGNPLGFVFATKQGDFYYSGDTALTLDMQLVPLWAKPDFAVLPIGGNFTMDVTDAIHAASFIQCNTVVGVHYNTFDVIKIDKQEAKEAFKAAGFSLLLPEIGETIDIKSGREDLVYV